MIVASSDFELTSDPTALTTYRFNTGTAKHLFCSTCGIYSFYVPRSHPTGFSVNARCISGAKLHWFDVEDFDGQNWEATVGAIR